MADKIFSKEHEEAVKNDWEQFINNWESRSRHSLDDDGLTATEHVQNIELQILKDIKIILFKRNESRLLNDGKFGEWNNILYDKFLEARYCLSYKQVRAHNRQALQRNLPKIKKQMKRYGSNLGEKLIQREEQGKKDDEDLNSEIRKEWKRLLPVICLKDLVVYGLDVLKQYKLKRIRS